MFIYIYINMNNFANLPGSNIWEDKQCSDFFVFFEKILDYKKIKGLIEDDVKIPIQKVTPNYFKKINPKLKNTFLLIKTTSLRREFNEDKRKSIILNYMSLYYSRFLKKVLSNFKENKTFVPHQENRNFLKRLTKIDSIYDEKISYCDLMNIILSRISTNGSLNINLEFHIYNESEIVIELIINNINIFYQRINSGKKTIIADEVILQNEIEKIEIPHYMRMSFNDVNDRLGNYGDGDNNENNNGKMQRANVVNMRVGTQVNNFPLAHAEIERKLNRDELRHAEFMNNHLDINSKGLPVQNTGNEELAKWRKISSAEWRARNLKKTKKKVKNIKKELLEPDSIYSKILSASKSKRSTSKKVKRSNIKKSSKIRWIKIDGIWKKK
jgi:hypothetical protein